MLREEEGKNEGEERRPGVMPLLDRGIRPMVPRFQQWEGLREEDFYLYNMARGRSRPFPTPQQFLQMHYRTHPHSLPHCLAAGFGHVAPNAQFPPRLNSPPLHTPNPTSLCSTPPPPQDQDSGAESSSSESSDSEGATPLKLIAACPKLYFILFIIINFLL